MTKTIHATHTTQQPNLSHAERNTLSEAIDQISNTIQMRKDLPSVSKEQQLTLLKELSQFELGRFLIQTGGLNGYWTHYVITHPKQGRITGRNSENKPFSPLESFLLNRAPACLATQQRFEIFKQEIQKRLFDGVSLASIPCGLSADLLDLDFSLISDFSLFGVDIDPESLAQSQQIAKTRALETHSTFLQKDAWTLDCDSTFDVIASNGLAIYEPDNQKVIALYRQFFTALKPNGVLITSFLTPRSEWDLSQVHSEDALLQKTIFADILACKWQTVRSEDLVKSQLLEAGFSEVEIHYDTAHIFPTIIAKKCPTTMQKTFASQNAKHIIGLKIRTNNATELDALKGKILPCVQHYFHQQIADTIPNRLFPGTTYCIYTDYESDYKGDYTYFIGEEVSSLEKIPQGLESMTIPAQKYVKFTNGPGTMPDVVRKPWMQIWQMDTNTLGGKRSYFADFEVYDERSQDHQNIVLDIYIGIQ